jgi:hypothetical protein
MSSQYEKRKAKTSPAETEEISLPLDRTAYDVYFDTVTRKYIRITLEYNLTSGEGRVKEFKVIADSQPVAVVKIGETMNRKIFGLKEKEEK